MLPEYRRYGLLGVTVGLQGGGSIYIPEVYDHYINSAFDPDGALKPAYCDRLLRVLKAADAAGLVVIVNYFYWKQVEKMHGEPAIVQATQEASEWLLQTGYRNILIDVYNEFNDGVKITQSARIHELIETAQGITLDGRRLLVSASSPTGSTATGAVGGDRRLLPTPRQRLLGAQAPPETPADQGHAGVPGQPATDPYERRFDVRQ